MSKKKHAAPRPRPEDLGLPRVGVETHAHLDMEPFDADLDEVLDRAAAAGIAAVGNVFLGPEAFERNAGRFAGRDEVFFLLGTHPHDAAGCDQTALARTEAAFRREPRLKALGEIGLDFFWNHSPREDQLRAFRDQLALARDLDLPVVIHSRDADDEVLAALLDQGFADRPVLWHCFGGDEAFARRLVGLGWVLSLPGTLTFSRNEALRQAAAATPLDRLVLETDCPYLTPEPYRGKRNEPAYVVFVAQCLAACRGQDVVEVWARCGDTARRFFGLEAREGMR